MENILGYLLTPIFLLLFVGTLVVFHIPLVLAFNLFGYHAHKVVLEWMNRSILMSLRFIGARFKVVRSGDLPLNRPLLIVSNHQSMYDVPLLLLAFRKHHPKFVAKVELSKGIPSISYALRHMGSAIIDRIDQKKSIAVIQEFGAEIKKNNYAACIFPEGTRARDGRMKRFKFGGVLTLMKQMPDALVVPVAITRSWELLRYKFWPVPYGVKVTVQILPAKEITQEDAKAFCLEIEQEIRKAVGAIEPEAIAAREHGQFSQAEI